MTTVPTNISNVEVAFPCAPRPPLVQIFGTDEHAEMREAVALLRATSRIIENETEQRPAELLVICQDRPGAIDQSFVEQLRRRAPLAGIVVIAGSWCEGEPRTGQPLVGVTRLYWYEFPAWWRRQLSRWDSGLCPEWMEADGGVRMIDRESACASRAIGTIVLAMNDFDTAESLADVLRPAGYSTVWQRPGRPQVKLDGVVAGVWDGGQLSEREAEELAAFCGSMNQQQAPLIALLDFPRRDRCDLAREMGAAAVIGKPWVNADLLEIVNGMVKTSSKKEKSALTRAA